MQAGDSQTGQAGSSEEQSRLGKDAQGGKTACLCAAVVQKCGNASCSQGVVVAEPCMVKERVPGCQGGSVCGMWHGGMQQKTQEELQDQEVIVSQCGPPNCDSLESEGMVQGQDCTCRKHMVQGIGQSA
jgi:hypothetical protein